MIRTRKVLLAAATLAALFPPAGEARAQAAGDALRDGFESPPSSALPRT